MSEHLRMVSTDKSHFQTSSVDKLIYCIASFHSVKPFSVSRYIYYNYLTLISVNKISCYIRVCLTFLLSHQDQCNAIINVPILTVSFWKFSYDG
jgi:hypothetical protein